jgi:integrase/recombinase XerD
VSAQPAPELARQLGEVERAIEEFFVARAPRKDSENTTAAYRRDLRSVLGEVARVLDVARADVTLAQIRDLRTMRRAFAAWSTPRQASTVRRCHSTWSEFFKFLVSEDLLDGSPMPGIPRPSAPPRVPRAFSEEDEARIIAAVLEAAVSRREPWPELDAAALFTLLLTVIRTGELLDANIGDITYTPGRQRIRVRGKGGKERVVPVEQVAIEVLEDYLRSRRARFPGQVRARGVAEDAPIWEWFPPDAPLFVDRSGGRMARGALQYLVKKVYIAAGVEATRARGALVHATRHTGATRLAEQGVTGIDLMLMLGHASLQTTQIYLTATAAAIRAAASKNSAYRQITEGRAALRGSAEPPDAEDVDTAT